MKLKDVANLVAFQYIIFHLAYPCDQTSNKADYDVIFEHRAN